MNVAHRWNNSGSILFGAEPQTHDQIRKARQRATQLDEPAEAFLLDRTETYPCGTYAAARRHTRHGEPLCPACSEAETVRNRHRWQKSRVARARAEGRTDWTRPPGVTL